MLQPLDVNFLRQLQYREANLKTVEVEVVSGEEEGEEEGGGGDCGISLKDGKDHLALTENSLKQLCEYLGLPYKFTKTLRSKGRIHAIPYLQRQLSQATFQDVTLVCTTKEGKVTVNSVTDAEKLHYRGQEAETFDQRLVELVSRPDSKFELSSRVCENNGRISYGIAFKEPKTLEEDRGDKDNNTPDLVGLWKAGFTLKHSVTGLVEPIIGVELLRMICSNLTYMPEKINSYRMPFEENFEEKWAHVEKFLLDPPQAPWNSLEDIVARLTRTYASFAEVKEARKNLMKLKVDAEDTETMQRINSALEWPRIQKAFCIKEMEDRPSRIWQERAATPLKLFDIFNLITREATHAPNTVDMDLRQKLLIYGGSVLAGRPDLLDNPPTINWDVN